MDNGLPTRRLPDGLQSKGGGKEVIPLALELDGMGKGLLGNDWQTWKDNGNKEAFATRL